MHSTRSTQICLFSIICLRFDKMKLGKSQKMSISELIHTNFANILNFGFVLGFVDDSGRNEVCPVNELRVVFA